MEILIPVAAVSIFIPPPLLFRSLSIGLSLLNLLTGVHLHTSKRLFAPTEPLEGKCVSGICVLANVSGLFSDPFGIVCFLDPFTTRALCNLMLALKS